MALRLTKNGTSSTGNTTYNLAAAEDWARGADGTVTIADLTSNAITASGNNNSPVIANLDTNSVAWVTGNTLTLDTGSNATVTDTENDVANWNGSTLTVKRYTSGGVADATSSDTFSLVESGFTLSGSNLKTGGNTFATYDTTVAGVLTVNFTGGGAAVTNTLVQDHSGEHQVVHRARRAAPRSRP